MRISKQVLCEMMIRTYARRVLGMKEPFELTDITEFPDNEERRFIFERQNLNFTVHDLAEAFIFIGMENKWAKETRDEIIRNELINSYVLLRDYMDDGNWLEITMYDILTSLPDTGSIETCQLCGQKFIRDDMRIRYCDDAHPSIGKPCSEVAATESISTIRKLRGTINLYFDELEKWRSLNEHNVITVDKLMAWYNSVAYYMKKVQSGELSIKEYQDWLKSGEVMIYREN